MKGLRHTPIIVNDSVTMAPDVEGGWVRYSAFDAATAFLKYTVEHQKTVIEKLTKMINKMEDKNG